MIGWSNMGAGQSFGFTVTQYAENTDFSNLTGKENEIAILTDTKISQWRCLSSLPSNPVTNEAIIIVGKDVDIAVPALKKQNITIYPYYVMQYISGEWVNKISKIYQGGVWVDLNYILFSNGFKAADWELNTVVSYTSYTIPGANGGAQGASIGNTLYVYDTNASCWQSTYIGLRMPILIPEYANYLNFNISNMTDLNTSAATCIISTSNTGNIASACLSVTYLRNTGQYQIDVSTARNTNVYIFFTAGVHCNGGGQTDYVIDKVWLS